MFVPGQSGNPNGRKPGPNVYGLDLLERNKRKLLKELVDKALAGDITALQFCAARLWPPLRAVTPKVSNIPLHNSLGAQGIEIIVSALTGVIGPDEAATLMSALASQARIVETGELLKRVERLEALRANSEKVTTYQVVEKKARRPLNPEPLLEEETDIEDQPQPPDD